MWEFVNGVTGSFSRRPPKRAAKGHMLPAMIIGAGMGIAAWEIVKRRGNQFHSRAANSDDPLLQAQAE